MTAWISPSRARSLQRRLSRARAGLRRGSALLLVMVLTVGLSMLAMGAIYLSAGDQILSRLYERERDFRYGAEAAMQLAKARINKDTLFQQALPETSYTQYDTGRTMVDAQGTTIPRVQVNTYIGYTGDTVGRFGKYLTVVSTAFDPGGTRHARRLDLSAESFSHYAMFTNTWPGGLSYGTGEFVNGRAHSNGNWASSGTPGPSYNDTVSATGTVSGTATYLLTPPVSGAPAIPFPTVAKLNDLPGYATQGSTNFTPVSGLNAKAVDGGGTNLSGTANAQAYRATRIEFAVVDLDNDAVADENDGVIKVFDLAVGFDTARIRADLVGNPVALTDQILLNQCGANFTIGGRQEFFPVASYRMPWVTARIQTSTLPPVTAAQAATYTPATRAGVVAILSLPTARCYPAGAPQLLITERLIDNTNCNLTAPAGATFMWGIGATCVAANRYGGQDTTFSPAPRTCNPNVAVVTGACTSTSLVIGTWRQAAAAIQITSIAAAVRQDAERLYLHPLTKPYSLNAKGVIYFGAAGAPVFASGTLRGFVTLYVLGRVGFIDDLIYDQPPSAALCRNFLGIIGRDNIMLTDNSMNRPKIINTGVNRLLGTPNFTLHAVTMSLTGTVGVENYAGALVTSPTTTCQGFSTSGGCINQTGGVIEQVITATYAGNGTGLRENRAVDPCQNTNRRPPFFPSTGRFLENKFYELDPVTIETQAQVRALFQSLRGRTLP